MVNSIMTTHYLKLSSQDTIRYALELMNDNKVNGAPVVDDQDILEGVIVTADIYRFLMEEGHYDTCPVNWVMTKKVITASKNDDVINIAKLLRKNEIHAVPVMDKNKVIGIITVEDIIDHFLKENN